VSQVASAAEHVSASSASLAQGAAEQAATLEETSASTEEINTMTQKNAENARAVADLMVESAPVVEALSASHRSMANAMTGIHSSSQKISKIISVIESIAFQTNILALNAAVEAARAGDAGLGFAVVAEEVRNLAQRCADAAKETTALIEESVGAAAAGRDGVDRVVSAIQENERIVGEVKIRAGDVSASSREQARGLEQIARAVLQMQDLTHRTSAQAEESAASSEELNAHAAELKQLVVELEAVAGHSA
jgi:methyl-accepting chemotaxis protein/methyl-accepting chemotaxis protein-1 (serine sensor receptor)